MKNFSSTKKSAPADWGKTRGQTSRGMYRAEEALYGIFKKKLGRFFLKNWGIT